MAVVVALVLAVIAGIVVVSTGLLDRARELVASEPDVAGEAVEAGVRQPSVVLMTHDETDPSGQANGLAVLAYDRETEQGTIVLVPTATVADVPGHGTFPLREAFALGREPLVDVTLANLLGVQFDTSASLSRQGWAVLLDRVGGYEVDVRSQLVVRDTDGGDDQVRFEPGPQRLDGERLAELLTFRGPGETELEALPRVQQVLVGLLEHIAAEPGVLDEVFEDGAPMIETSDPDLVQAVLAALADARADDRVTTLTLPVSPLDSTDQDAYRLDRARTDALVEDQLASSRPADGAGAGRRVQILNGKGVPGIGQAVAEALGDGGYRVVLTGNADHFGYETTRIVIYGESEEQLTVARDVRDRLGVGEIERSETPQSVVDVTIVVGEDFPA